MIDKAGGDIPNMNDGTIDGAAFALGDIIESEMAAEAATDTEAGAKVRDDAGKFVKREAEQGKPAEKAADAKDKPDEAKAAEADEDEDYFEIEEPGEDGQPKPVRVKASEVWEGFQRSKELAAELDAARKAQPMPEEQERVLSDMVQRLQRYDQALAEFEQFVPVPEPSIDMLNPASQSYDTEGYYRQLTQHRAAAEKLQAVRAERQRTNEMQRQHAETLAAQRHSRERAKVLELIPELKDKAAAEKFKADLIGKFGFDEAIINSVQDHRFYVLAKHALNDLNRQSAAKEAVKVVRSKPKLIRASAKGNQSPAQARAGEASARLAKSGSIEDAADAIAGLI